MSRYTFGFIAGGLGLIGGCAIGLMVAPASGAELRRRLAWGLDEQRHSLARRMDRLKERVGSACAEARASRSTAA